jgi:type II secretory ATPase GspE/PulE/Tfp pilus assembly ATPase PilB-like protein
LAASVALADGVVAALPEPSGYLSWMRIVLILVLVMPWLAFCQWVDADCQFLRKKMNRELWNGVVLGGGLVGLALWLLMPWTSTGLFAAGFGLWFAVTVGTCAVYVVIRNGMVDYSARVFTPRHIKTTLSNLGKSKEVKLDAVERVRLTDHEGRKAPPPEDPNEMDAYEAAQELLFDSFWRRATEVNLLVAPRGKRLVYTIDGVKVPRNDLFDLQTADNALKYIKATAGLDVSERRRPQEGQISGALSGGERGSTEVEVRTSGTTQGELLRMRIVSQETRLRLTDLGLAETQREQIETICGQTGGLVLISGPRASGITTTLYALLRAHDAFIHNLLTIEREPLMDLENVTQHIYDSTKQEVSYARQLQTVLRREPDVVLVSDCEDRDTAFHAAKAAVEGKRIYMGIQSKDSFDALKKLLSLATDMDVVSKALLAVISQRLVRKLCVACRQAYRPDRQLLKKANLPVDKIEHFYRPPPEGAVDEKGNPIICPNCQNSGYFGRTGVFEILAINPAIRKLIAKGQPVSSIEKEARKAGMLYLQQAGLQKVMDGTTSMNEVLRALRDEEAGPSRKGR